MVENKKYQQYWKTNLKYLAFLLSVWFVVSYGYGILFVSFTYVAGQMRGVGIVFSRYFGINPTEFVAQVVAFVFRLAAASFFPAIIMGIFSKRINKYGAVTGMI